MAALVLTVAGGTRCCFSQSLIEQQRQGRAAQLSGKYEDAPLLRVVLSIAKRNRIPLGIVFGQRQDVLCNLRATVDVSALSVSDAFAEALRGSGYSATEHGKAWLIQAPDPSGQALDALAFRYDFFPASEASMWELGRTLDLWMKLLAQKEPSVGRPSVTHWCGRRSGFPR